MPKGVLVSHPRGDVRAVVEDDAASCTAAFFTQCVQVEEGLSRFRMEGDR